MWFLCLFLDHDLEYIDRTEPDIDDGFCQCKRCGKCWPF